MAFNLMALLGQAGLAPQLNEEGFDPNAEIVSTGKKVPRPVYEGPTYRQDLDQEIPQYQDVRQAQADQSLMPRTEASPQEIARQENLKGLTPHKGMFGIKGTFRDVLGVLGDALLVGGGGRASYAPKKEQEGISDALVGYGQGDPDADNAALARLAQRSPEMYQQFMQQHQQKLHQQQQAEYQKQRAGIADQAEVRKQRADGIKLYAQALSGMGPDNYDPTVLNQLVEEYSLPSGFQPGPAYDANLAKRLVAAGTPRNTQVSEQQGGQRIAETGRHNRVSESIAQQNASSNALRAKKAGSSRAPNPTDASMAAPILAKIRAGQPLTDGEKDVLQRTGHGTNRGRAQTVQERVAAGKKGGSAPAAGGLVRQGNNIFRKTANGYEFVRTAN